MRSYRGAKYDSDQYMIKSVYRFKISTTRGIKINPLRKFDLEKLKNDLIAEEHKAKLEDRLDPILRSFTRKPIDDT